MTRAQSGCTLRTTLGGFPLDTATLGSTLAALALEKKANDPVLLQLGKFVSYCDAFLVVSGNNSRQVRAIAEHLVARMKADHGVSPVSVEGLNSARWVLIDFGDVIVHVFEEKYRGFYDLEGLWSDAPRLAIPVAPAAAALS